MPDEDPDAMSEPEPEPDLADAPCSRPIRVPDVASPPLKLVSHESVTVWDVRYPSDLDINDLDVIDDWIEHVDQALIEARNGVTTISWPLALGGMLATLAVSAEIFDKTDSGKLGTPAGWIDLAVQSPARTLICALLAALTVGAMRLASQGTEARRSLVAVRAAYLRRRRQLHNP